MLSRSRSTVKQTTLLSRPRSTVKQTTRCHVPEVPSNKLHVVTFQKYRQTNYVLSRSRSIVKQTTLLSHPRSSAKQTTCYHVPEVPSNKLHCCHTPEVPSNKHGVTFEKYSRTNYMLSRPEVSNIHINLWFDTKYFQILFHIMFPFTIYFGKRILHPSRFCFPCFCLQLPRPSKLFHTKSVSVFIMYLHTIDHV